MAVADSIELSDEAIDGLLTRQTAGVLAIARDDEPYAVPISYGFDPVDRSFYFRLVHAVGGEKEVFLRDGQPARFVVCESTEERIRSVVATGELRSVDRDDLTPEDVERFGDATRPLFEVWSEPIGDLDIDLYRFAPGRLSGVEAPHIGR